jgi:hypothetical protein
METPINLCNQELPLGVTVFDSDLGLDDHRSWLSFMAELYNGGTLRLALSDGPEATGSLPNKLNGVTGRSYELSRGQEVNGSLSYRDPWANDFFWHTDGASWVGDEPPLLTGIYCREAAKGAPGLEIIDSSLLYDEVVGVIGASLLEEVSLEYRLGTTYRDFQPGLIEHGQFGELMVRRMCEQHGIEYGDDQGLELLINAMREYADRIDSQNDNFCRTIPLVCINPLTGKNAIHMDIGQRTVPSNPDHAEVLETIRSVLDSDIPNLHKIDMVPGRMIFFLREGILHRAMPGNEIPRQLLIGHLAVRS